MTPEQQAILAIAVVTAAACALPGVFLVLRRLALLSDAISHAILLGIVLGYFAVRDLGSPLLLLGAALTGLVTVSMVELLQRTRLVREDAAIGLVFPVLFSLGVILVSRYAGNIHLDTDAVLRGNLEYAPFAELSLGRWTLRPRGLCVMGAILLLNAAFIGLFYKELKLATFDAGLAAALGFAPGLLHYALMALVSVTAVGAFDEVGSILVVALMIAPPAAAYLVTERLSGMLAWSVGFGVASAVAGYWLAHLIDANTASSMATMSGVLFGLTYLLAPEHGLIALALRRRRQRWEFARTMLAIHLLHHEGRPEAEEESRVEHLPHHLRWSPAFTARAMRSAERLGLVERDGDRLSLTAAGREMARQALVR
jgi:manganese/zinc/iron transport system permease protein